jgi:hypothetical protein
MQPLVREFVAIVGRHARTTLPPTLNGSMAWAKVKFQSRPVVRPENRHWLLWVKARLDARKGDDAFALHTGQWQERPRKGVRRPGSSASPRQRQLLDSSRLEDDRCNQGHFGTPRRRHTKNGPQRAGRFSLVSAE